MSTLIHHHLSDSEMSLRTPHLAECHCQIVYSNRQEQSEVFAALSRFNRDVPLDIGTHYLAEGHSAPVERDSQKSLGTHHIFREGPCPVSIGTFRWPSGHCFGTLPAGETRPKLRDTILGRKFPIGTLFRDSTNSPTHGSYVKYAK